MYCSHEIVNSYIGIEVRLWLTDMIAAGKVVTMAVVLDEIVSDMDESVVASSDAQDVDVVIDTDMDQKIMGSLENGSHLDNLR